MYKLFFKVYEGILLRKASWQTAVLPTVANLGPCGGGSEAMSLAGIPTLREVASYESAE